MTRCDHHSPKIVIIDQHPRQRSPIAIEALPIDDPHDRCTTDHRSSKRTCRLPPPLLQIAMGMAPNIGRIQISDADALTPKSERIAINHIGRAGRGQKQQGNTGRLHCFSARPSVLRPTFKIRAIPATDSAPLSIMRRA